MNNIIKTLSENLTLVEIVIGALALAGIYYILKTLTGGRKILTSEVEMQMAANSRPQRVDVQQPMRIEAHDGPVPMSKHKALESKVDNFIEKTDERLKSLQEGVGDLGKTVSRIEGKLEARKP